MPNSSACLLIDVQYMLVIIPDIHHEDPGHAVSSLANRLYKYTIKIYIVICYLNPLFFSPVTLSWQHCSLDEPNDLSLFTKELKCCGRKAHRHIESSKIVTLLMASILNPALKRIMPSGKSIPISYILCGCICITFLKWHCRKKQNRWVIIRG